MSITLHNRRTILKAGTVGLAIPMMESVAAANAPTTAPKRFLMIGCGYGFTKETFFPTESGRFADIGLTPGLKPLQRHRDDITMVSNLTNLGATNAHGGSTSYLTGANVSGTPGKKFHNSISLDQVIARRIGQDTRFPTIPISDKDNNDGHGPGLSLSWSDKGHPIPGVTNPLDLYHQLFGQDKETDAEREFRLSQRRSVLDGMVADLKSSSRQLSQTDQRKLKDYLESIRQIEKSISREVEWANTPKPDAPLKQPKDTMDGLAALKTLQKTNHRRVPNRFNSSHHVSPTHQLNPEELAIRPRRTLAVSLQPRSSQTRSVRAERHPIHGTFCWPDRYVQASRRHPRPKPLRVNSHQLRFQPAHRPWTERLPGSLHWRRCSQLEVRRAHRATTKRHAAVKLLADFSSTCRHTT